MTEEESDIHDRNHTKKSSVAVYFVLMLFGCVLVGVAGGALGTSPLASWGLAGLLLLGAVYWCFKLEMKHRKENPKQSWEKAQAKRTAVVAVLIIGITAILLAAGQGFAAFCILLLSLGVCVAYLWAYTLVEPYAKDRKSAIWLAITIIVVVAIAAYASRQAQKPALEQKANPTINR